MCQAHLNQVKTLKERIEELQQWLSQKQQVETDSLAIRNFEAIIATKNRQFEDLASENATMRINQI